MPVLRPGIHPWCLVVSPQVKECVCDQRSIASFLTRGVKESLGDHLVLWEGSRAWVQEGFLMQNPCQICSIHQLHGHSRRTWNQICVPWGDPPPWSGFHSTLQSEYHTCQIPWNLVQFFSLGDMHVGCWEVSVCSMFQVPEEQLLNSLCLTMNLGSPPATLCWSEGRHRQC